jgi:hypothetical protein
LLITNHKRIQPCYLSPATQTCYSEDEDGLEFFDVEFLACLAPVVYSRGLWSIPLFCFHERVV